MVIRLFLITICFFIVPTFVKAQDWRFQLGDTWYNWIYSIDNPLRIDIGEKMDFKYYGINIDKAVTIGINEKFDKNIDGKLIIFDFWSTNCSDCIAKFPKMESIQKQFNDKIQIFLVNPVETKEEIDRRFEYGKSKIKMPNLPSIIDVDAMRLGRYFHPRGVPLHVWIDKDNIVRIIGSSHNTYEGNIEKFLNGESVFNLNTGSTVPSFNEHYPYYKILNKVIDTTKGNSFITPYNNEYVGTAGGQINKINDRNGMIRSTYINKEIINLYQKVFEGLKKNVDNLLFQNAFTEFPFVLLYVNDSSRFSDRFMFDNINRHPTDTDYVKTRFCYEQVVPAIWTEDKRSYYMLEQLNNYFKKAYNVEAKIEAKLMHCYAIIRTSTKSKIISKQEGIEFEHFVKDGKKMLKARNADLKSVIQGVFNIKADVKSILLVDDTELKQKRVKVDMVLPDEIKSIEELRTALKKYDLDIVEKEKIFDFLVIKENDYKGNIQ